jgi:hypothetical protein
MARYHLLAVLCRASKRSCGKEIKETPTRCTLAVLIVCIELRLIMVIGPTESGSHILSVNINCINRVLMLLCCGFTEMAMAH